MARLIIGHVTPISAMIWVRGERKYPVAYLGVEPGGTTASKVLEERHGYTHAFTVTGLKPDTEYRCFVEFGARSGTAPTHRVDFGHCRGTFRTSPAEGTNTPFKMLLGSCNLHSLGVVASPDPAYEELLSKASAHDARFMIHCGDQIYYDIPNPANAPDVDEYRGKYLDAWGDSRPTRKLLTQLPHYMIMDDHEITDDFANDMKPKMGSPPRSYRQISMKVYREFVHIRQPNVYGRQALYYSFAHGSTQFFVMDCRTERYGFSPGHFRMISDEQMRAFTRWLTKHKDALKFVVSSVPFVGEISNDNDKWCAPAFESQRNEIIDHVVSTSSSSPTFLTGDMHNSYHATMTVDSTTVIHELMSSPINQLQKTGIGRYARNVQKTTGGGHAYTSKILKFYNDHSNAMIVGVDQGTISYEIFRTKKTKKVRSGEFTP